MANVPSPLFASCSPCGRSPNHHSDASMSLTSTWICTIVESLWISCWSCQSGSTSDSLSSLLPSPPAIYPKPASSKSTSFRIRNESGVKRGMKTFEMSSSDNKRNVYVHSHCIFLFYCMCVLPGGLLLLFFTLKPVSVRPGTFKDVDWFVR